MNLHQGIQLPLERAVTVARRTVKTAFATHPVAWATPVLFMRCPSKEVLSLPTTSLGDEISDVTINIGHAGQVIGHVEKLDVSIGS